MVHVHRLFCDFGWLAESCKCICRMKEGTNDGKAGGGVGAWHCSVPSPAGGNAMQGTVHQFFAVLDTNELY